MSPWVLCILWCIVSTSSHTLSWSCQCCLIDRVWIVKDELGATARPESGVVGRGGGSEPPHHQLGTLGSTVSTQGGPGWSPGQWKVVLHFIGTRWLGFSQNLIYRVFNWGIPANPRAAVPKMNWEGGYITITGRLTSPNYVRQFKPSARCTYGNDWQTA